MVADLILINQNQIKHIHLNFFYKIHTKVFHNLSNWITLLVFEILGKFYVVIPFLLTNKVYTTGFLNVNWSLYFLNQINQNNLSHFMNISKYNMCSLLYIIILCIQTVHWSVYLTGIAFHISYFLIWISNVILHLHLKFNIINLNFTKADTKVWYNTSEVWFHHWKTDKSFKQVYIFWFF